MSKWATWWGLSTNQIAFHLNHLKANFTEAYFLVLFFPITQASCLIGFKGWIWRSFVHRENGPHQRGSCRICSRNISRTWDFVAVVTPEGFHTRSREVLRGVLPRSRNSFDGGLELNMLQHRWETIAIIGCLFNSESHGQVYAIRCKE